MHLSGPDFQEIYKNILIRIEQEGDIIAKAKTISNLSFELTNPQYSLINLRKNWNWALHEGINRMSWEDPFLMNPGTAYQFRPAWKKKLEKEDGEFDYSYGERYAQQIPALLKILKAKTEREAILTVWDDDHLVNRNLYQRRPCTIALHFYRMVNPSGDTILECQCFMRTSDVMNLLPYDVFHHTLMQRYIASVLGIKMGSFYFTASIAYYQKKRDVTGSVANTIKKLETDSYPVIKHTGWEFSESDRFRLMGFVNEIFVKDDPDFATQNIFPFLESKFSQNYANALLYYYYKKQGSSELEDLDLGEFNMVKL